MKHLTIILSLFLSHYSHGQKWSVLTNTAIKRLKLSGGYDNITYFTNDSSMVAISNVFADDFSQLFIENPGCLDSICRKLTAVVPEFFVHDSLLKYFQECKIKHLVYLSQRTVRRIDDVKLLWSITNLYGEGQPCDTQIIVRKIIKRGQMRFKFISVKEVTCQL
ncbi:MAG: hypothetical protein Q8941_13430 [Bacteroidota bacterium]|nr:hypothetical protein [Bacteroidota bacterium]